MDNKDKRYCSLTHEYLWDFLSTLEDKESSKRANAQRNRLSIKKAVEVDSNGDTRSRVTYKKNSRTGVFNSHN